MSFGLTNDDFGPARLKAALPFFLGQVIFITLVLAVLLWGARMRLAGVELALTNELVDDYIHRVSKSPFWSGSALQLAEEQLGGLAFLRISRSSNRLLLTDETINEELFHQLLRLEAISEHPWRRLVAEDDHVWSIVTRSLPGGVELMAGRENRVGYTYFYEFCIVLFGVWVVSLLLALPASVWLASRQAAPLVELLHDLEELVEHDRDHRIGESRNNRDQAQLAEKLNQLIARNRRLVEVMQASLDNVAHDLRTPMTRLRAVAEFGLQEEQDIGKLRNSLADCLEESERVLSMLRIMMSVAEAETGTISLELEYVDLTESITEMASLYEYVAEEQAITIDVNLPAGLSIQADRTRIAQVWANLMDNGIKYGKSGGYLRVEGGGAGGMARVRFVDNGMGISASEQPRIWQRLYRGDRSRSKQGLGLGLNFVKAIVEAHGGAVNVESHLHEGSVFTVELPLVDPLPEGRGQRVMEKSQISGE